MAATTFAANALSPRLVGVFDFVKNAVSAPGGDGDSVDTASGASTRMEAVSAHYTEEQITELAAEGTRKGLWHAMAALTFLHSYQGLVRLRQREELREFFHRTSSDVAIYDLCVLLLGTTDWYIEEVEWDDETQERLKGHTMMVGSVVGALIESYAGFDRAERALPMATIRYSHGPSNLRTFADTLLAHDGCMGLPPAVPRGRRDQPLGKTVAFEAAVAGALDGSYLSSFAKRAIEYARTIPPDEDGAGEDSEDDQDR